MICMCLYHNQHNSSTYIVAGRVGRNSEFTFVAHHVLYTLCFVLQRQHVHHIYVCMYVCMYDGGEVHVCYNST